MKVIGLSGFGGSEVLQFEERAVPEVGVGQLLVRVRATALNRADIHQRRGKYPPPKGESDILGLEIAGDVEVIGEKVSGFNVGDRVFGLVPGGGYEQYCLIDAEMAMPIPQAWDYATAAAIPEVFFTANETIFELGELKSSESILIHAGGSGVGTAGIQMAHSIGARVFFTAGSDEKIKKALALGGDHGINYKSEDFVAVILSLSEGVDVVEDFIGADYVNRNLTVLKPGGRLIQVAMMGGRHATIDTSLLLRKRLQIKGSIMRSLPLSEKREITKRFRQRWLPLLQEGTIKPIIDSILPWSKVQAAHQRMEKNENFGKIVLIVED